MQHILHLFIGEGLKDFRDLFSETFRHLNADIPQPCFTALSLTADAEGVMTISTAPQGDEKDNVVLDKEDPRTSFVNFLDDLYTRKVTVACPGNRSMVVMIWSRLFEAEIGISKIKTDEIIKFVMDVLSNCRSNFKSQLTGFTNDAVSCFIKELSSRLSPKTYKEIFENNLNSLSELRSSLQAFRLISNYNTEDVALNLHSEELARICSEFSGLLSRHYLDFVRHLGDDTGTYESFGLSSIIFDYQYYRDYIATRAVVDKMKEERVDNRHFNLNGLAQRTDPILERSMKEIESFYARNATDAKASLALKGAGSETDIVAAIDPQIDEIIDRLRKRVSELIDDKKLSVFECEAILALILGDDSTFFDVSAISADEKVIDDIIDEAAQYYINLDPEGTKLLTVTQDQIKSVRTRMRNIASVNRERQQRLTQLEKNKKEAAEIKHHLAANGYRFGDTDYKVDLEIDSEPLEDTYAPGHVEKESVDLREKFEKIRNQGNQSSCAAFAVASTIEALRHDHNLYSPAYLYWNAREVDGNTNEDTGSSLFKVLKGAMDKGVCNEEMMKYNPAVYNVRPTVKADNDATDCMVLEACNVNLNVDDIRSALSEGYPVIVAVRIFDSFADSKSGFVSLPTRAEVIASDTNEKHAYHAMVVCGYSDKERFFLVRNSWGTQFGDKGYCYIPYVYAKQYFLQACLIKRVTSGATDFTREINRTLDFNEKDANIETAILKNLINEDNLLLEELSGDSQRLKTAWTQNVSILGNVNYQNQLIRTEQGRFDVKIEELTDKIKELNDTFTKKLKSYKKRWWEWIIYSVIACLVTYAFVWIFPEYVLSWIFAAIATTFTVVLCGAFWYRYRLHRQTLLDEIESNSVFLDKLLSQQRSIGIQGHIRGKILREVNKYRLELLNRLQKLHAFNVSSLSIYQEKENQLSKMSPTVPYPFLTVLENKYLDRFYESLKHKISDAINLHTILQNYNPEDELLQLIVTNTNFLKAINDGLQGFSMKEYLVRQNPGRWSFLPEGGNLKSVLQKLEENALPFCRYNSMIEEGKEEYLFVKDITRADMTQLSKYFISEPMPVSISNPFSISLVNIVRYS